MMTDNFIVPGTYMTEKYNSYQGGNHVTPEDLPQGMSASNSKKTADKSPTANKEAYEDWPATLSPGDFPGIYSSPATQEGGGPDAGGMRMRKISHFVNNQSSLPGINLGDAMPLSPMVEREVHHPMNFAIILMTILFAVFVAMRK